MTEHTVTPPDPSDDGARGQVVYSGPWIEVQSNTEITELCEALEKYAEAHQVASDPDVTYYPDDEAVIVEASLPSKLDHMQFTDDLTKFKRERCINHFDDIMDRIEDHKNDD